MGKYEERLRYAKKDRGGNGKKERMWKIEAMIEEIERERERDVEKMSKGNEEIMRTEMENKKINRSEDKE